MVSRPVYKEEWPELEFLCNEVTTLWFEKKLIDGLFSDTEQTIHLMNMGAKHFFVSLQSTLPLNAIRILSTIFDRQKTGRNSNVTIEGLVAQSQMWCDPDIYNECVQLLSDHSDQIGKLRKFRNKRLAHLDRVVAVNGQQYSVTVTDVNDLSNLAATVLNKIQGNLFQGTTAFEQPIANFPHDILHCIKMHLWLREIQRLIRKNHLTTEEAGLLVRCGTRGQKWAAWCMKKQLAADYFVNPEDFPEIVK